jgi:nucleoid DNA-binding protein
LPKATKKPQSLTKAVLAKRVARRYKLFSQKETIKIIDSILGIISQALVQTARVSEKEASNKGKKNVELRGFGSFKVKRRDSRRARNPKTAVDVSVPAKWIPYFKISKEFREIMCAQNK